MAVIGSGLAGLSAAWLLSRDNRFEVQLYEAQKEPGLGAHSITSLNKETGKSVDVDIPLRIGVCPHITDFDTIYLLNALPTPAAPTYYPELLALYSELGIELYTANSSSSLSSFFTGLTYFRYCNVLLGKRAFPLFPVRNCLNKDFLLIAGDFVYFRLVLIMLSWSCVMDSRSPAL